jgi:hypothetical protein
MKVMKTITIIAVFFGLAIGLNACMGEDPDGLALHDHLREGRRSLQAGDAGHAYNHFYEARKIAPLHPAALWGTVLSNDLLVWRAISGMVDLLGGPYIYSPSREECFDGCLKIDACDLWDEFRTSREQCISDCPWKLQPYMFEELVAAPICDDIRYGAGQWIVRTTPENCQRLCVSLDYNGLINPPETYSVEECIINCPFMYVERHSECYLNNGYMTINRFDRTCFEHSVLGVQILEDAFALKRGPETIEFSQYLLDRPDGYQYYLKYYQWDLKEPPLEWNLNGRFSRSELYLSRALTHTWAAFINLAISQNLDLNTVAFDQYTWQGSTCKIALWDLRRVLRHLLHDPIFIDAFRLKREKWTEASEEQVQASIDKSLNHMRATGLALGNMFDEFAKMSSAILGSTDRQHGRALGYTDENWNFRWDEDEVLEIPDLELTFTKKQMFAFQEFCEVMAECFLTGTSVDMDDLKLILEALGYGDYAIAVDLLKLITEREDINFSYPFMYPSEEGIRPLVLSIAQMLDDLYDESDNLPGFLECDELDYWEDYQPYSE